MMKKILKKISLLKIVTLLLIVAILFSVLTKLPEHLMKYTDVNEVYKDQVTTLGIAKGDYKCLDEHKGDNVDFVMAEAGGRTLYVNPTTMGIKVVDDATGTVWTSIPAGVEPKSDDNEFKTSPMIVTFLEATGTLTEWDVYTQCIALDNTTKEIDESEEVKDTYSIYQIPGGFRAELNVTQEDSKELDQYMPKKISIERFEECFLSKTHEMKQKAIEKVKEISGIELTIPEEVVTKTVKGSKRDYKKDGNIDTAKLNEVVSEMENADEVRAKLDAPLDEIKTAEKYEKALDMIYDIDAETGDHYYNKYSGTPPATVTDILIELSKKVKYTREDLVNDTRDNNVADIEFSQPADFIVTMDVTLDENGDLIVHIPTYEIVNNSEDEDYYTLQSIAVFPNFGTVNANEYDEGFIFVPDGSGALFDINTLDSDYTEYSRQIYNNKYYSELYNNSEFNEDLMMPVFGMGVKGATVLKAEEPAEDEEGAAAEEAEETETEVVEEKPEWVTANIETEAKKDKNVYSGFMGIIEKGAETADLTVTLGAKSSDELPYNKIYPTFELMQYSKVKVFGPYSDNNAEFLAKTSVFNMDIKVRYKLYTDDCNYYTMAQDYKDYLVNTYNLEEKYNNKTPEIFLDVVSALTVEDRFMGVPYDKTISMTTYSELNDILNDLGDVEAVVSYKGAYNGGIYNTVNQKATKTKANGSQKEYDELMINHGDSIYMSTPISYVYKDNSVFNADKHGLLGYDSDPVEVFEYDIPSGRFNMHGNGHWIVSPFYLPKIVESFASSAGNTKLAIEDLGNIVYANYDPDTEVTLYNGEVVVQQALKKLKEGDRGLVLYNAIATRIPYADYVADVSRESSDYGLFKHNVPFRQLVMNGLTKYTTINVNESSSGKNYYLLQALELGSMPKYQITAKSVDILKENNYNELYSTQYSLIADDIKAMYATMSAEFAKIGTNEIAGHKILADKVFETTYATGAKVVTNYNTFDVDVDGYGNIAAEGYVVISGSDAAADTTVEAEVNEADAAAELDTDATEGGE